jgi:hypothetical protein
MAVTGPVSTGSQPLMLQIEKITASPILHGSDALCKLLRYLGAAAVGHSAIPIKEYQIATEVFRRSPEFDPKFDSTVRVQTGRLRAKLAEYYSTEGSDDEVVIEIPKGSYLLTFHVRKAGEVVSDRVPHPPEPRILSTPASGWNRWTAVITAGVFVVIAVLISGLLHYRAQATDWAQALEADGIQPSDLPTLTYGTTTFGTQAAVSFVCNPDRLRELLQAVTGSPNRDIRPFQAVLRIRVSKGVPVLSTIAALHVAGS